MVEKRLNDADCIRTDFGNFRIIRIGLHANPVDKPQILCRLCIFFHRQVIESGFIQMRKCRHHDRRREVFTPKLHRDIRHMRSDDALFYEDFIQKLSCMPARVRGVFGQCRDEPFRARPVCFFFHIEFSCFALINLW